MDLGLKDKVAIITGAAAHPDDFPYSGQGENTARLLVQEGAKVVLADIKRELGQKLADDLTAQGSGDILYQCGDPIVDKEDQHQLGYSPYYGCVGYGDCPGKP